MLAKTNIEIVENKSPDPFKQKIAIIMPFALLGSTFLIFQLYGILFGPFLAWILGLMTYWLTWCLLFPLWMIGKNRIKELIRPQKPNMMIVALVIIPMLLASIWRFASGMGYVKENLWNLVWLIITAFGNGFFEELLWRGVYMDVFPEKNRYRIGWSTLWFALWHFIPGTVSPNPTTIPLVVGSGLFGIYLSLLAKKSGTIFWSIIAHILGAFIMIA